MIEHKITQELSERISHSLGGNSEDVRTLFQTPPNPEQGDLSLPTFLIAKRLGEKPPIVAERIATEIRCAAIGYVKEVRTAGPYVNIVLERGYVVSEVTKRVLTGGHKVSIRARRPETVVIDFSSPNIAKPFHVGHLRGTLIGNCLYRLHQYLGDKTISVNHLGDWGTQFGFVWAGCELWGTPENLSVSSLVELYRKATALKSAQEKGEVSTEDASAPNVNDMARKYFVDLEAGVEYAKTFWKWCLDISLVYFKETYARFDIVFDHYTGESFYSDKLEEVVEILRSSALLEESEGAFGVPLGDTLGFARISTPDGRSLYLTRDIATALYRSREFKFDRSLYVVGTPQSLHFQQLIELLRRLNLKFAEKMRHIGFGHVAGMKTRGGGEFIELNSFLDEAFERSLTAYQEQVSRRPVGIDENEVAGAVARSAILFGTLSKGRIRDVSFSWDHALAFQGDSGPYLLYAYARISSIRVRAGEDFKSIDVGDIERSDFDEPEAMELARVIDRFEVALDQAQREEEPSVIAAYCLDLAKAISRAYNALPIVGHSDAATVAAGETATEKASRLKKPRARMALFIAAQSVLADALDILGINVIEKM